MSMDPQILAYLVEMIKVGGAYGVFGLAIYSVSPAIIFCSGCVTVSACIAALYSFFRRS